MLIDAHQHFWNPDEGEYGWLSGPFAPIRRVFSPEDLKPELAANGIDATVLVQTWSSVAETRAFLTLAEKTSFIAGVVGWVDLTDPHVETAIRELKVGPGGRHLVGIRHQVHDEPDPEWLLREDVRRGLEAVAKENLTYDLLLKPRELRAAHKIVQAMPHLRFVIDHIAKPNISGNGFAPWAELVAPFAAERSHVWCKLSGMVTEARWESWTVEDLQPYIDEVLRLFEPSRTLYGSDWPVCRVAGGYSKWLSALKLAIAQLPAKDQGKILGGSAVELYRLPI